MTDHINDVIKKVMTDAEMLEKLQAAFKGNGALKLIIAARETIESLKVRIDQNYSMLARIETCLEIWKTSKNLNNNQIIPEHLVVIRNQISERIKDKDHD